MQGKFKSGTQPISVNDQGDFADSAGSVPELPLPGQRWTVRRKAAVVEAVRGGWVPVEEISQLYDLSADEIVAWERDIDRYGIPGLRSTRLQIYRDTDRANAASPTVVALRRRYVGGRRFRLTRRSASNSGTGGHEPAAERRRDWRESEPSSTA